MNKFVTGVASAALLAVSTMALQAADTTMRISLQLPLKSHLGQNLLMFKEEVESKSGGDIAVEIYDSAQLYKDKEVPQAVGAGSIEAGVASLTRYVGDVPMVDIFYQPFLFDSEDKVRKAVAPDSPVRGPIDAAIAETGATVLWWQAYGGAIMLSKGGPIATPADMEGKKVRVFGKTLGDFTEAAGGAPTIISGSEQYPRLSARHSRYRDDRCLWCSVPLALGSDGNDHCDQPRGYRIYCRGQHRLVERTARRASRTYQRSSGKCRKRRA